MLLAALTLVKLEVEALPVEFAPMPDDFPTLLDLVPAPDVAPP